MLDTLANHRRVAVAQELLNNLQAREQTQPSASLQSNVATLVAREAANRLKRECSGDDDSEFYALEDRIVDEAFALLQTLLHNALQ
jgi:hypothetical protein